MKTKLIVLMVLCTMGCQQKPDGSTTGSTSQAKKEVLLMGTFHYRNPGQDVAKTKSFDILSEKSQLELEHISSKIKDYRPSQIFVEWPYDKQQELDSLYTLYQRGIFFSNDSLSEYYLKNEIFQLAFRIAKKSGLNRVYGIDYRETEFPYQRVMDDLDSNNQTDLKEKIENSIAQFSGTFDRMIESGASLEQLTLELNTDEMRYASNNLHNNMFSMAGTVKDSNGVYLTSEWYKRNLFMWSFIQKYTSDSDQRVMVLIGASHAAIMELFIKGNKDWGIIGFQDVMQE